MTVRIKVDGARELARLRREVKRAPKLLDAIGLQVGEEFLGLVQDGFREQRNPFGHAWPPKKRPDGRAILVGRTTRLRRSWHLERTARGVITIASAVVYTPYHQHGTRRMPARKMVPDDELPPAWNAALNETALELLEQHFNR
jgi:phage gpG-like protein